MKSGIVSRSDDSSATAMTELRMRASEDSPGNGVFLVNGDSVTMLEEITTQEGALFYFVSSGRRKGFLRAEYCRPAE